MSSTASHLRTTSILLRASSTRSLGCRTAVLCSLAAVATACGTSPGPSDVHASGDAAADVGPDAIITVPSDGAASVDAFSAEAGTGEDATTGGPDAASDAHGADHSVPPADAATDSFSAPDADAGSALDAGNADAASQPEGSADSGVDAPTGITVSGHVRSLGDSFFAAGMTPLAFREIGIRGATGKVATTTTDATGAFQIAGIEVPYDAVVYPGSPSDYPYVFMGLSTPHPRLMGAVTLTQFTSAVTTSVQFQNCGSSTCQCSATWWFPDLGTYAALGCGPISSNNLTVSLSPSLSWTGQVSTTADLHVLEWDPQAQHFWYGVASGVSFTGGLPTTVPPIVLASVPTAGTVTMTATAPGLPATWQQQASLLLNYANGDGWAGIAEFASLPLVSGIPNIPGATIQVGVQASDPNGGVLTGALVSAGASNLPLASATIPLTLQPPPTLTSPQNNGSLSKTGTIAWSGAQSQEATMMLLLPYSQGDAGPVFTGAVDAVVYTSATTVDLARLADLSLSLTTGSTQLQLRNYGKVASLDAIVDEQTLAQPDGSQSSWVMSVFSMTP